MTGTGRYCISYAVALVLLILMVGLAQALPPIAAEIYGGVRYFNGSEVGAGTSIGAYDSDGNMCGNAYTSQTGLFGLLSCLGDDPSSAEDEGLVPGEEIRLYINGVIAFGNSKVYWQEGSYLFVNLTLNFPPTISACSNGTVGEDGNGSNVSIDLWACADDLEDTDEQLAFSVMSQSDSSLIDCFIMDDRYLTCHDPMPDASGHSDIVIRVTDRGDKWDEATIRVTVFPINDAPYFVHNLTDQKVNESLAFYYKVNCSDVDNATTYYYDNFSRFDIRPDGQINWTPWQDDVGNYSILITCSDGELNASQAFRLEVVDINLPPVLLTIGNQIGIERQRFTLFITAYDLDYDNLTFYTNTSVFGVEFFNHTGIYTEGLINFIPVLSHVGNHSVSIIVSDGFVNITETIRFRIVRGPYCGDSYCGSDESCQICPQDCGPCPVAPQPPRPPAIEPPAEEEEEAPLPRPRPRICEEKWECSEWNVCPPEEIQTRKCADVNDCGTKTDKPGESQACEYIPRCDDLILNADETDIDCGGSCPLCSVGKRCFADSDCATEWCHLGRCALPSCNDGVKNQDEEGVDCGGPCEPCAEIKMARMPFVEKPLELVRAFPWILLIIASLLMLMTAASDYAYLHHISGKPFKAYRRARSDYRGLRRRIYTAAFDILFIAGVSSAYIYYYSTDPAGLLRNLWMPVLAMAAIPAAVSFAVSQMTYSEWKRARKEKVMKQVHRQETRRLIALEEKVSSDICAGIVRKLLEMVNERRFNPYPELYAVIKPIYSSIIRMEKLRLERAGYEKPDQDTVKLAKKSLSERHFAHAARSYPELREIIKTLQRLAVAYSRRYEEEFLDLMAEVSRPHMMSVIRSDAHLVKTYNSLVDIYTSIAERQASIRRNEASLAQLEKDYLGMVQRLASQTRATVQARKIGSDFIHVYNSIIDLHDHLNKKFQLYHDMEILEKSNKMG
ncbi:MAG: Ig-like domain-containing protein [archaeon]